MKIQGAEARAGGTCRNSPKLQNPSFLPTLSTKHAVAPVDTINSWALGKQLVSRKRTEDADRGLREKVWLEVGGVTRWGGKLEAGLSFLVGAGGIRGLFLLASIGRGRGGI